MSTADVTPEPDDGVITCLADLQVVLNELRASAAAARQPNADATTFTFPAIEGRWPWHIWFRGEADFSGVAGGKQLTPGILRRVGHGEGGHFLPEPELVEYARNRYTVFGDPTQSVFACLCRMQHYGLPTRLLDWTESLGTALFFALDGSDERDGLIYGLNARKLNRTTTLVKKEKEGWRNIATEGTFTSLFLSGFALASTPDQWYSTVKELAPTFGWDQHSEHFPREGDFTEKGVPKSALDFCSRPVAAMPGFSNTRTVAQQSLFTLHGGWPHSNEGTPRAQGLEELNATASPDGRFLKRWRVPAEHRDDLRMELRILGFNSARAYPDQPDKLARAIKEMFR